MRHEIVELGRACVHRQHRNLVVLGLLWKGIADYARERGGRYLIGCSSLTSQDAGGRRFRLRWTLPQPSGGPAVAHRTTARLRMPARSAAGRVRSHSQAVARLSDGRGENLRAARAGPAVSKRLIFSPCWILKHCRRRPASVFSVDLRWRCGLKSAHDIPRRRSGLFGLPGKRR